MSPQFKRHFNRLVLEDPAVNRRGWSIIQDKLGILGPAGFLVNILTVRLLCLSLGCFCQYLNPWGCLDFSKQWLYPIQTTVTVAEKQARVVQTWSNNNWKRASILEHRKQLIVNEYQSFPKIWSPNTCQSIFKHPFGSVWTLDGFGLFWDL